MAWLMFEEPTAQGHPLLTATGRDSPAAGETAVLAEVTKQLLGALAIDDAVRRSLTACVPLLACWAQLLVPGRHGYTCTSVGPEDGRTATVQVARPATVGPLSGHARVLTTGLAEVVPIESIAFWVADERTPRELRARGAAELLVLPLIARGVPFGTLALADPGTGHSDPEPTLVTELAGRVAVALDAARVHAERARIADAVAARRAANRPASTPGIVLASRLRRGTRPAEDGGDFLDVAGTAGDWLVFLGDVVPCRVPAPLLSVQAQDIVRGASRFERRPAELLRALNLELTERSRPGDDVRLLSAVCLRVLQTSADALDVALSVAGHPRPLVVRRAGDVEVVAVHGRLCGASTTTVYTEVQVSLGPGDMLLLVSDGVPDAEGVPGRFGVDRLARLAYAYREAPPAALADAVDLAVTEFTARRPGEPVDDSTVVVIGTEPP